VDERLLIPVSLLPGPVPAGAPTVHLFGCAESEHPAHAPVGLRVGDGAGFCSACSCRRTYGRGAALDLSPPPTDAAGWPLAVDGLDVAAGMLARAYGYGLDGGVWVWHVRGGLHIETRWNAASFNAPADIDPTDALAPRLAMAAVLRARPWVRS